MDRASLAHSHCMPLKGAQHRLDSAGLAQAREIFTHWQLAEDGSEMFRVLRFADYHHTMAFVNALAWVAHNQDHHPDLEVGYNRVRVRFSTHDVGGLSLNDLICAARCDQLVEGRRGG
ncbi:MAG: 4a-hydroxytetrahydrobiopterin dehydratase [Xanthomonadales bacterium]|jgi:4a-hydroxytetrahydrobiopterin dehydratase|nr:4a-hydroxytetrahydrobiopterin dehydratase [Xanthomonadales bacterium]